MGRFLICALAACPLVWGASRKSDARVVMLEWAVPFNLSAADQYRSLTRELVEPTQSEPGCSHFDVYEDIDPATNLPRIWQYLVFKDEQAHQAHMDSEVVKTWINSIEGLLQKSKLTPMTMLAPEQEPITCLKQPATTSRFNIIVEVYTETVSQHEQMKELLVNGMETVRAEEGVLYYDQLIPVSDGSMPYIQEIFWFTDAAAQQKHLVLVREAFSKLTFAPRFTSAIPVGYTTLPVCAMAVDV